jgi:hypothetical protein
MGGSQQTRKSIEAWGAIVPVLWRCGSGVQRHPDLQRLYGIGPGCGQKGSLGIERRGDCGWGRGESRLASVPHGLEQHAAMGLDRGTQELEVAIDRFCHRLLVPLPERGAPLDVGEEEGDSATGEFGHGPLQTLG